MNYSAAGVDTHFASKLIRQFSRFQKTRPASKAVKIVDGIGPFAACIRLQELSPGKLLVASCDGVGTKTKLARDWNFVDGLGQDLVAMNVNDLLCMGARPLFFLDYYACGKLERSSYLKILKSIQSACEKVSMSLIGGETAEMPGMYQRGDIDLAGFAVGILDEKNRLGVGRIREGDVVVGLASSGLHSNGFSLIRRLIEKKRLKPEERTPFSKKTWKKILLEPTVLYSPLLLPQLKKIHGLCHLTGGGVVENLPRILPRHLDAVLDLSKWPRTPLFSWIQDAAQMSTLECLSTFNFGIGMLVVCEAKSQKELQRNFEAQGVESVQLGEIARGSGRVLWKKSAS